METEKKVRSAKQTKRRKSKKKKRHQQNNLQAEYNNKLRTIGHMMSFEATRKWASSKKT